MAGTVEITEEVAVDGVDSEKDEAEVEEEDTTDTSDDLSSSTSMP